jgi:hypothetical protein
MDAPRLIAPDDPLIRDTVGVGAPTRRALRARLRRMEDAGLWPERLYLSSQRYCYRAEEVLEALERLPRDHVATLGEAAA